MLKLYHLILGSKNHLFTFFISRSFKRFGHKSKIELPSRLNGTDKIEIGEYVFIGSDSWISTQSIKDTSNDPIICIKDRTSISGHTTISGVKKIVIEEDVLIARYTYISDHSHRYDIHGTPVNLQGLTNINPVKIEKGAWLGQSVVICPGVTVGAYSVIGANSVVTKSIPDYCVAAGAPAKVIRKI